MSCVQCGGSGQVQVVVDGAVKQEVCPRCAGYMGRDDIKVEGTGWLPSSARAPPQGSAGQMPPCRVSSP